MQIFRLVMLLLLLFVGGYSTHVAGKRVKEHKVNQKRMAQSKNDLTESDFAFMRMALNHDHVPTSKSLIVMDGGIIGTGWNGITSASDPAEHSMLSAVREATNHLNSLSLKGSVIYSSTQLCPMCLSLLYLMEVDKIVYFEDSESPGLSCGGLQNQLFYGSLLKVSSERAIPEIVLGPNDLL